MKIKKIILAIVILLFTIANTISIVLGAENVVITASKTEAGLGEEINLILDISKIEYQNFRVEILNNLNIGEGRLEEGEAQLESSTSNSLSFTANKDNSLSKIIVAYTMPMNETNVKFSIKLIELKENQITSPENDEVKTKTKETGNVLEEEVTINVSKNNIEVSNETDIQNQTGGINPENKDEQKNPDLEEDRQESEENKMKEKPFGEKDLLEDKDKEKEYDNMKNMMKQMEENLQNANKEIKSLQNTNVYQGSQNNYLKELVVSGYELKNNFQKTTSTYFLDVGSEVQNLNISATPENSASVVTVYGNSNLKTGKNKILITVTAEDGTTRNYRVYVTKK